MRRRLPTWLVLLLCAALGAGSAGARVICVGDGGHVAVEHPASCADGPGLRAGESSSAPAARPSLSESDCGPCVDVPIGMPGLNRVVIQQAPLADAPLVAVAVLPVDPASLAPNAAAEPEPDQLSAARSPASLSLRSTVLLL